MMDFGTFFEAATGCQPYGYQARIARDGLPDVIKVPTGAGKTGVILAWLWRRLYGPDQDRTPRRLVYVLPQRSILDEVSASVRTWLGNLGLSDRVAVHVVQGARSDSWGDWRENMHQPAIVVGTADLLVSRALIRGYGIDQAIYPIDFALVCNGAQWIVDEIELCPQATMTLRQLAGLTGVLGTAEPFGLTCMTSIGSDGLLTTVGNPSAGETIEIAPHERSGDLAVRLDARRTIRRAPVDPGDYAALAGFVRASHRTGTLTLAVLHDVPAAQEVYRLLRDGRVPCALLHSQFRGVERAARLADVLASPSDLMVVSAGEAASGLDLTASVVVTEAAPWPSMVRRIGRGNRSGAARDAEVWWLPPASPAPDERAAVAAACAALARLEGVSVTGEDLAERPVPFPRAQVTVIGRAGFEDLFDNASGSAEDIDRYVGNVGDSDVDVDVAWATWIPGADGAPDPEVRFPAPEYRCRVSIGDAVSLAGDRPAWRFDQATWEWRRVTRQSLLRPYDLLLVAAADGGYDQETGFDPLARTRVPDSPQALTPVGLVPTLAPRKWQSVDEHSEQVRDQAVALLDVLAPSITPDAARAVVVAGYLHDCGKAHPIWQDALCALADESERDAIAAGRPWAKSGTTGPLEFAGGVAFRHELASLLLLGGPLRGLLAASGDPDLTRYLVLAHHGKLRVQVRDEPDPVVLSSGEASERKIRGLEHGASSPIPAMLGVAASTLTVDLDQFGPDGDPPWTRTVRGLLAKYGPFTLAYLETMVRIADWRASGGRELPE